MTRAHVSKDACVSKTFMRQQQEMYGNDWLGWVGHPKVGTCVSLNGAGHPRRMGKSEMLKNAKSNRVIKRQTITYLFKIFKLLYGHNIFYIKWKINSRFDYFHTVVFVFSLQSQ